MTASVAVSNVTFSHGHDVVLSGVSLAASTGEVVGIAGPNGVGKTTLLRLIAGDLHPAHGSVELAGAPTTSASLVELAKTRAYLSPNQASDLFFSVREIVAMGRHPYANTPGAASDDEIVTSAMHELDVGHLADRPIRLLSTGELQRVGLARVVAQRTPILLLDEPTSSLDIGHQEMVMRTVRSCADNGGTVVVVLHDLNLAAAHTDRMVLLDGGRVAAQGAPSEVLTADVLTAAYRQPVVVIPHPHRNCPLVLTIDGGTS